MQSKVEKTDSKTDKSNVTDGKVDGKVDGKAPDVIVESHNVRHHISKHKYSTSILQSYRVATLGIL